MELKFNEEKLNKLIDKFINLIRDKHPIKLLKKLYIYKFLVTYGKKDDFKHLNTIILTNMITYLISIYQSINLDMDNSNDITFENLENLIELFKEIYFYSSVDNEFSSDSKVTSLKDVSSGISYPMVTIEIIINILSSQEELIKVRYGVDIDFLCQELVHLSQKLLGLPIEINLDRDDLFVKINNELPDSFFDLSKKTQLPLKLLKELSNPIDNTSNYLTRETYAGWPNIDTPSKFHPLLEYEDGFYAFDHNIIFDYLYRNIQRQVTKDDKHKQEQWNKNQQISSEGLVSHIFNQILKDSKQYQNNFYYESKSKRLENDLLIVDNDLLLVVEVKAGSFSYRSAVTDSGSHEKSIQNLVDKPQAQVQSFLDNLKDKQKLEIYDENKNHITTINSINFNYIIGVTVTIDHFNEITATYYNTEDDKIVALPISIYDLFILVKYFDNKFEFIHYLLFRMGMFAAGMLVIDELVYLEMYITNHHSNQMIIEEKKRLNAGLIMMDPTVEMIDKYFNKYPKLNRRDKPIKKVHGDIKRMIRIISDKSGDTFVASTTLLEIPYELQRDVIREYKDKAEWGNRNKKFGFGTTGNDKIQLTIGYIDINRLNKFNLNYMFNELMASYPDKDNVMVCAIYDRKTKKILDVLFKSEIKGNR